MDTSFRDGFQSVHGARVLTPDFLPALQASKEAGITHFEAGGGARFQSLFFYCNESAFDMMDSFRETAGPEANLQTLARGINVVALSQQPRDIIDLHAKMFKQHGMTTIRNFDALNDIRNLEYSAERIKAQGLYHQVVVSIMDLPPGCAGAHSAEFYLERLRQIQKSGLPYDSICFKDASGTANPHKVYETFKGARQLVGENTTLWFHTHDTAGTAIACNLAAIEGGADGIDLCKSPVSHGTAQADIITMWHALKGTDYTLDVDIEKILIASEVFEDCMKDYFIPPEAKMVSPVIPLSPMPGGALTANTMMMRDTGTLHLYNDVIKEMSEVVRKGGFGTSVTPVSQFYFQQAYMNVTQGRWKKIWRDYGDMVLGYFGRTPVPADSEVVKLASEQLGKPPFEGNPLDNIEAGIPKATQILKEHNLEVTDENLFIIASCESKGLDFLTGKASVNIRKTTPEETASVKSGKKAAPAGPRAYTITVDGKAFSVQVAEGGVVTSAVPTQAEADKPQSDTHIDGFEVLAPTPGTIFKILVSEGEHVEKDQPLVILEAMKMETEIKSPKVGTVVAVHVMEKDSIQASEPLITLL